MKNWKVLSQKKVAKSSTSTNIDRVIINVAGLEIVTDTVTNATNIFSLATKNSGLVAKVATRF